MGATFSRIKNWTQEVLTHLDLNAEIDNILTNLTPTGVDDYSTNVAQMQTQTDPGELATESLATSLAGEVARLRFAIQEIKGASTTYWYQSAVTSLYDLSNAVGGGLARNRISSGRVRTGSQFPTFLVPNGAAQTVKLDGTPTPFVYYINGIQYSITADVTLTGLGAAPSSNNTASVNVTAATGQDWTRYLGENGSSLDMTGCQTGIAALVGSYAGLSLSNGVTTEYMVGYVASTSSITKARRGYFLDSTDTPVPRVTLSNGNEIKLLRLTWIYATTASALTATYNNPVWGKDQPTSPSVGDFWYDTVNSAWMTYSVGSWSTASATLVGVCLQTGAACVGARSFEQAVGFSSQNTYEICPESVTQIKSRYEGGVANVWGTKVSNDHGLYTWDITADLDTSITESANTNYFMYLTEQGDKIISDIRPYDRSEDLGGWYHPHQSWRALGYVRNDNSSNFAEVNSYFRRYPGRDIGVSHSAAMTVEVIDRFIRCNAAGGSYAEFIPAASLWRGQSIQFLKTSSDFNNVTLSHNGTLCSTLNTQNELLTFMSDGTTPIVVDRRIPSTWTIYTPSSNVITADATTLGYWMRVGDSIRCNYKFIFLQQNSFTALDVNVPSGLTVAGTVLNTAALTTPVGQSIFFNPDTGSSFYFMDMYKTNVSIGHKYIDANGLLQNVVGSSPAAYTVSSTLIGSFLVPVQGWNP